MSVAAIRGQIRAVLLTVANIGVVHDYERYANSASELAAHYKSPAHGQIRGWFIRRIRTEERGPAGPARIEIVQWEIRGFVSLADAVASEKTVDDLIEEIRGAFRNHGTLNGTVAQQSAPVPQNTTGQRGIQLLDFGPVMFGDVLCHGVRLGLVTMRAF